jgi:hypothetical protein
MRLHHLFLATAFTATTIAASITACGSDGDGNVGTGPNNALYDSWNATSFQALGTDFIADGMTLVITFNVAGTYTLDITNDLIGACDPDPDCTTGGDFTGSASQITLDPGSPDEVTFNYSIVGTTLTLTGSIEGNPVTITLERV